MLCKTLIKNMTVLIQDRYNPQQRFAGSSSRHANPINNKYNISSLLKEFQSPAMDNSQIIPEQPFAAAFASCSLDPCLLHAQYSHISKHYFMTDIIIGLNASQPSYLGYEHYILNDQYALFVGRDDKKEPIVDVGVFEQLPEGWARAGMEEGLQGPAEGWLCVRRGVREQSDSCVFSVELHDESEEEKMEEVTQPSLTDKSQLINSYLKIEIGQLTKYISFNKKTHVDIHSLRFMPKTECLYQRSPGEVDIPSIAVLCFPEGVKIFNKESGFKFFTFILTNDQAQRYYCNSIVFSQRLPAVTEKNLEKKFGIRNERGIYSQKIFTLISQHSCTDQTNKCLEYLYRLYLSKPYEIFQEKINRLPIEFKYNLQTHKSSFSVQDFGLCFKVSSSYPHTSTQAIYGIFKFLQVQNIVTVVQNLLLERKVFFISDCENMVGMAIEAFLSFIYPMNWIHGIITPLSSVMLDYTEAPMTITYGLCNALVDKIKPSVDGLFVFIDKNRVELRNNPEVRLVPALRKQLIERLKQFSCYDAIDVRDYLDNPQNLSLFKTQQNQDPHFNPYRIRNIFFELTVFMLRNYKDYFLDKSKKQIDENNARVAGIKKFYDIDRLLQLYRKDPFMCTFLKTSLFSVLLEKKRYEPDNKWIKTLDRAIRKIAGFKKHYIQQESDAYSEGEEPEIEQQLFPRGCMGIINFYGKDNDEDKSLSSSPTTKKSISLEEKNTSQQYSSPRKQHARLSLPNDYDRKGSLTLSPVNQSPHNDKQSQQTQKQTSRGSNPTIRSENSIPELPDNGEALIYQFQVEEGNQEQVGMSHLLCNFFSYPYKKVSNSVVSRWTKKKLNQLRQWRIKAKQLQEQKEKQINLQPQPKVN